MALGGPLPACLPVTEVRQPPHPVGAGHHSLTMDCAKSAASKREREARIEEKLRLLLKKNWPEKGGASDGHLGVRGFKKKNRLKTVRRGQTKVLEQCCNGVVAPFHAFILV